MEPTRPEPRPLAVPNITPAGCLAVAVLTSIGWVVLLGLLYLTSIVLKAIS